MPRHKSNKRKPKIKQRPANEISQQEIDLFLDSVRNYPGYLKVRDLQKLLPSLNLVKITTILKYLIRTGDIILDSESNITWSRADSKRDGLSLGEVADITDDFKSYVTDLDGSSNNVL